MQIQAISSVKQNKNQNFRGNVNIVNDLSYLPCKYVRQAYDSMNELIKDKPFDLFIRQNHGKHSLNFIAKKPQHLGKINKPFVENTISNASNLDNGVYTKELYAIVAEMTINSYEKAFLPVKKEGNVKTFFNKLVNKFLSVMQDKDEI